MTNPLNPPDPGSVTGDLRRLQQGIEDTKAQKDLFRRYYRTVVEDARRRLNREAVVDASDVAVSVWDTVFRGLATGQHPCRDRQEFEALLGRITYHKAVNLFNWVKRPSRHPAQMLANEEVLKSNSLGERDRRTAELHYLESKTDQEIADQLEISLDEVCERLGRIQRWLQRHRYRPTNHAAHEFVENVQGGDRPHEALLFQELILSLEESLQKTVVLKLQGLDNQQIALALNISTRQVQRRLKLLRAMLEAELQDEY